MKRYTVKEIIWFIDENLSDIDEYESCAEKAGGAIGTLAAVKCQLENLKY